MKKILFFSFFCYMFSIVTFAQKANDLADFNLVLSKIPEIKAGDKLTSAQIEKSLEISLEKKVVWNVFWDKNSYKKVEESFGYPIAYYKRTDKVIVLFYTTGEKGNVISHFIDVATFNAKTGKRIDALILTGAYAGTSNASAEIFLSKDLKKVTVSTTTFSKNDVIFDISGSGKIKDSK